MARDNDDVEDEDESDEDVEYVLFQGALNGKEANLEDNRKLAAAGLRPAKELVSEALADKCDSFRFEPKGPRYVASFSVDGVRRAGPRFPVKLGNAIVQILKLLAGLDPGVRDKKQQGAIKAEYREIKFEITVKAIPGKEGESLSVIFRATKIKRIVPDDIGIPDRICKLIRGQAANGNGVVLIVGPPESGLTTTAHCAMRSIDTYRFESFILGEMGNREILNVSVFEPDPDHTLDDTIERIHRNDGKVIYFTDLEDPAVAKTICDNAGRICVVAEMTAPDAPRGVAKFVEMVGDPALVASQLKAVVTSKLIRKLCRKCREAFRPTGRLLAQLGLPEDTATLYRAAAPPDEEDLEEGEEPEVCRACDGVGFRGRAAIFEMVEVTDGMKEVIAAGADPVAIKNKVREEKQLTMQMDALRLVADGTTGLEELQRAFRPPQRKKKPARRRRP
ncbi:MAG: ATPase, T2SS/T4P/T4SS family [Planctomycetota bacterium]|nr:ATPase, T2SS/T4P/T4SS family [Planctomycetota bacterium]MDA1251276.1 ATPase, T2SS/T4P/T4SS family [Planctomycetota bacterium]